MKKLKWNSGKEAPPDSGTIIFCKYRGSAYIGEVEGERVVSSDFPTVDDREQGVKVTKIEWRLLCDVMDLFE